MHEPRNRTGGCPDRDYLVQDRIAVLVPLACCEENHNCKSSLMAHPSAAAPLVEHICMQLGCQDTER
jgi:hypothetical protein